jgi:hypothetical protein
MISMCVKWTSYFGLVFGWFIGFKSRFAYIFKGKPLFDKTQFWHLEIYMENVYINIKMGIVIVP